jgi:hypothetical protein
MERPPSEPISRLALGETMQNLDATINALVLLDTLKTVHAKTMPPAAWSYLHHAHARLNAEVDAYFRGKDIASPSVVRVR